MARWTPDAAGRLRAAAMAQFTERGYEATTVADIATRAGVTPRTFFRHYADKREVLFAGSADLEATMVDAVLAAPPGAAPLDAVVAGVTAGVERIGVDRTWSRERQQLIATTAELRERELSKLDRLGAALTDALRTRGVPDPAAGLAADTGIVVFRQAFAHWVAAADDDLTLPAVVVELFATLRAVTARKPLLPPVGAPRRAR